jgi:hypothetical protein
MGPFFLVVYNSNCRQMLPPRLGLLVPGYRNNGAYASQQLWPGKFRCTFGVRRYHTRYQGWTSSGVGEYRSQPELYDNPEYPWTCTSNAYRVACPGVQIVVKPPRTPPLVASRCDRFSLLEPFRTNSQLPPKIPEFSLF